MTWNTILIPLEILNIETEISFTGVYITRFYEHICVNSSYFPFLIQLGFFFKINYSSF